MTDLSNENVIHVKKDGGSYLKFRRLERYPEIRHMFTLKPYDFATYAAYEEKREAANAAEEFVKNELGIEALCRSKQTHSDHTVVVGMADRGIFPPQLNDIDGLITNERGLGLLQTFADCTPLLFYDPEKHVVANTHSGWKGTLKRIGFKTVTQLKEHFGCAPENVICCIGPHIRSCSFEVDKDVSDLFAEEFSDLKERVIRFDPDKYKYFIDTAEINRQMLLKAGLKDENIIDSGICTVCESDICQSYRADRALSGRAAALIALI